MRGWLLSTFAAFNVPAYRVYWLGTLLNFSALWTVIVARGFLAFDMTESSAALGALFLAFGVPQLAFTMFGGVLADRAPRRPVIIAGQVLFALNIVILAVFIVANRIEFWMLFVSSSVDGVLVAFVIPTRQAMIGDLVSQSSLGNAVALQQVSFNIARVVAPIVAGVTIAVATIGVGGTYLIAAALYVGTLLIFMRLPYTRAQPAERRGSPIAEIVAGIRYLRGRPALLVLVMVAYALEMTAFTYAVFVPAVVAEVFDRGSVALGVMTSGMAIGALVAAVAIAWVADRPAAWRVHGTAALGFGVLLMLFALAPTFLTAVLAGVALGGGEIAFFSLNMSLSMRYSDPEYYGRVQSVLLLGFAIFGIAALPTGLVADAVGIRGTLFAQGTLAVVLMSAILLYSRRIGGAADARPPSRPAEPEVAS